MLNSRFRIENHGPKCPDAQVASKGAGNHCCSYREDLQRSQTLGRRRHSCGYRDAVLHTTTEEAEGEYVRSRTSCYRTRIYYQPSSILILTHRLYIGLNPSCVGRENAIVEAGNLYYWNKTAGGSQQVEVLEADPLCQPVRNLLLNDQSIPA